MTRTLMPSAASVSAALSASATMRPVAATATSVPGRSTSALPISKEKLSSSWITGTAARPKRMYTGPLCS